MDDPAEASIDAVIDRALAAYSALAELGEEIDDEWSYIQDLTETWRDRFETLRAGRGGEVLEAETATAIDVAINEIGRIEDPHRAIDWLSTFPQVAITALGERP
ncbi:MAG TPA: hypothetical protein VFN41_14835 [Candidatus Limnocylindrales bacterium]|nr:hypothetical protein [Candidatus Limnocylindrales bacterium]